MERVEQQFPPERVSASKQQFPSGVWRENEKIVRGFFIAT